MSAKLKKKRDESCNIQPWLYANLSRIADIAPNQTLATEFHSPDFIQNRTRYRILAHAQSLAAFLSKQNIPRGSIVAVDAMPSIEIPAIWTAIQSIGATALFFPPDMPCQTMASQLEQLDKKQPAPALPQKTLLFCACAKRAKLCLDANPLRTIILLPSLANDDNNADAIFGWPLPKTLLNYSALLDAPENFKIPQRICENSAACITYTQGSKNGVRPVSISYRTLDAQTREICEKLQINANSRVFTDMRQNSTTALATIAACLFSGATWICQNPSSNLQTAIQNAAPTHAWLLPQNIAKLTQHLQTASTNTITQKYRKLCLNFKKFKLKNTKKWPVWTSSLVQSLCIRPMRAHGLDKLQAVISYGNHFQTKTADFLALLDIPTFNAFCIAELGVIHCHPYTTQNSLPPDATKIHSGFFKFIDAKIKNGELLVRAKHENMPYIDTGDLVLEDARCGLCSQRRITFTLSDQMPVDASAICGLLKRYTIIEEAYIYGQNRPYLTALIYLRPQTLENLAKNLHVSAATFKTRAESPQIYTHVKNIVAACNLRRGPREIIQKIAIIPTPLQDDSGILTPCGLLRYGEIRKKYACLLNGFYADSF